MHDMMISCLVDGLMNGRLTLAELSETLNFTAQAKQEFSSECIADARKDSAKQQLLRQKLEYYLIGHHFLYVEDKDATLKQLGMSLLRSSAATAATETAVHSSAALAHVASVVPFSDVLVAAQSVADVRYVKEHETQDNMMQQLVRDIEQDCKTKCQLYGLLCKAYDAKLQALPDRSPEKAAVLSEFAEVHDYFEDYIKKSQQNIARLGATIQTLASQGRVTFVRNIVQLLSCGLHAIGPVGSFVGIGLSLASNGARLAAVEYTTHSARYNHAIVPENILCIQNVDDLKSALNTIRTLDTSIVIFSDPVMTIPCKSFKSSFPKSVVCQCPPYPKAYDDLAMLAWRDQPIPDSLTQAQTAQSALWSEIKWYTKLLQEIMQTYAPENDWPVISNLKAMQDLLLKKADCLAHVLKDLSARIPENDPQRHVIDRLTYQSSITPFLLKDFDETAKKAAQSIYSSYFRKEDQTHAQTTAMSDMNYDARQLQEIPRQLDGLGHLLHACEQMNNGRHIRNLPELLSENNTHLQRMKDRLNENTYTEYMNRLHALYDRGILIDEARLTYLRDSKAHHGLSACDYLHELKDLRQKVSRYPRAFMDLKSSNLIRMIDLEIAQVMPSIHTELQQILCVKQASLKKDTLLICPSRQAFGLFKRSVQEEEAYDTTQRIFTQEHAIDAPEQPVAIQILPLTKIDITLFAATRGDEKKLADVIEGLKTEMQWVKTLCTTPPPAGLYRAGQPSPIQNLPELKQYYKHQIDFIKHILEKRENMMNDQWTHTFASHHDLDPHAIRNSAARAGSFFTNQIRSSTLGQSVLRNSKTELSKCEQEFEALERIDSTTNPSTELRQQLLSLQTPSDSSSSETPPSTSLNHK